MKRFLSLLLALLLCLSFIVSCEKEEAPSSSLNSSSESSSNIPSSSGEPSSSSESSSSELPSNDAHSWLITTRSRSKYYYHTPAFETFFTNRDVQIPESLEELLGLLRALNGESTSAPEYIDENVFTSHYVILLVNYGVADSSSIMGYRDVTKTDDGYVIVMDTKNICDGIYLSETGFAGSMYEVNDESLSPDENVTGTYRIVLIPKSEFDTPPTAENIQIHNVIYTFTK